MSVLSSVLRPVLQPVLGSVFDTSVGGGSREEAIERRLMKNKQVRLTPTTELTASTPVSLSVPTTVPNPLVVWGFDRANNRIAPQIRGLDTRPIQAGAAFPDYNHLRPDPSIITFAPGTVTRTSQSYEFNYGTGVFDVLVKRTGSPSEDIYWVYLDGVIARKIETQDFVNAGVNAGSTLRVPFSLSRPGVIRIVNAAGGVFGGLVVDTSVSLFPTTDPLPRTLFVGDSFVEGGSATPERNFVLWQYVLTNARNMWKCGSGSTGYVASGTRTALVDRYTNDIIAQAPDKLIVAMGLNDRNVYQANSAEFVTRVSAMYDAIGTALPNCKTLVIGPFSNRGGEFTDPVLVAMDISLQGIAEPRGLPFVSPIQEGWITGNGRVGAPTGNGNADIYISADGTHLSPAGHEYFGPKIGVPLVLHGFEQA